MQWNHTGLIIIWSPLSCVLFLKMSDTTLFVLSQICATNPDQLCNINKSVLASGKKKRPPYMYLFINHWMSSLGKHKMRMVMNYWYNPGGKQPRSNCMSSSPGCSQCLRVRLMGLHAHNWAVIGLFIDNSEKPANLAKVLNMFECPRNGTLGARWLSALASMCQEGMLRQVYYIGVEVFKGSHRHNMPLWRKLMTIIRLKWSERPIYQRH